MGAGRWRWWSAERSGAWRRSDVQRTASVSSEGVPRHCASVCVDRATTLAPLDPGRPDQSDRACGGLVLGTCLALAVSLGVLASPSTDAAPTHCSGLLFDCCAALVGVRVIQDS